MIKIPRVRLIDETGKQIGIVSNFEALRIAREKELDLVEIVPTADPPVCKIINYDKYRYQKAKEQESQKAKQRKVDIKGIRIGLRTDQNDLIIKKRQAEKFLDKGHKIKIELLLKGREKAHKELAKELLHNFINSIERSKKIEQKIQRFPQGMNVIISPD